MKNRVRVILLIDADTFLRQGITATALGEDVLKEWAGSVGIDLGTSVGSIITDKPVPNTVRGRFEEKGVVVESAEKVVIQ